MAPSSSRPQFLRSWRRQFGRRRGNWFRIIVNKSTDYNRENVAVYHIFY